MGHMGSDHIVDFDAAFDNVGAIKDAISYPAEWSARAEAFRGSMDVTQLRVDIPYGDGARNRFDLFLPEHALLGTVVFVHGGYWKAFDKSYWSHLAAGPLCRGWAVAIPSYTLCPAARLSDIAREMASFLDHLATMLSGPIRLTGHSAGGQLIARSICDDSRIAASTLLRVDRIVPISGLYDLRPLLKTKMNDVLRLDQQEAEEESPLLLKPRKRTEVVCFVGELELAIFRNQNTLLPNLWSASGLQCAEHTVAGRHHFNIIDQLGDSNSSITNALVI